MDTALEIGTATVLANYLVSMAKHAKPDMVSWLLIVVAAISGVSATFLFSIAQNGIVLDTQTVATNIIMGITAAAAAAGLTRTDASAEAKRLDARAKQAIHVPIDNR